MPLAVPGKPVQHPEMRRRLLLALPIFAVLRVWPARAQAAPPRLMLSAGDLLSDPPGLSLRPGVPLPSAPPDLPPIDPDDRSPESGMLRRAVAQGRAAGLAGVIYDNRDRNHSALPADLFPPMTRLQYAADLRAQGLDYGLAVPILLPAPVAPAPVIGNSSTAITSGPAPRSLPRAAMTTPGGPQRAFAAYAGNQIYVYPEHRDHDAADRFPANWPYMLISQGSSRSDRPLLRAAGLILGALPPAVRAAAEAQGLIGPTVQMLFRRGNVRGNVAAYLTGAAHPTVFDGQALNPVAMMQLAGLMTAEDLPPLVRLSVLSEDFGPSAGLAGLSERLFDTPSAIARIWRGQAFRREITLSTALTDPAGIARWHWVLLRGDPARVRIMPLAAGASARIELDWHDPGAPAAAAAGQTVRRGQRIDIGVFAETAGGQISAPAMVSVSLPLHEDRIYGPGPDGRMRLLSVDHDALGRGSAFDPLLYRSAPWRDDMIWAPDGRLAGWRRTATTEAGAAAAGIYDAEGNRDGQPVVLDPGEPRRPVLSLR
jgi:hypothetical protein